MGFDIKEVYKKSLREKFCILAELRPVGEMINPDVLLDYMDVINLIADEVESSQEYVEKVVREANISLNNQPRKLSEYHMKIANQDRCYPLYFTARICTCVMDSIIAVETFSSGMYTKSAVCVHFPTLRNVMRSYKKSKENRF